MDFPLKWDRENRFCENIVFLEEMKLRQDTKAFMQGVSTGAYKFSEPETHGAGAVPEGVSGSLLTYAERSVLAPADQLALEAKRKDDLRGKVLNNIQHNQLEVSQMRLGQFRERAAKERWLTSLADNEGYVECENGVYFSALDSRSPVGDRPDDKLADLIADAAFVNRCSYEEASAHVMRKHPLLTAFAVNQPPKDGQFHWAGTVDFTNFKLLLNSEAIKTLPKPVRKAN